MVRKRRKARALAVAQEDADAVKAMLQASVHINGTGCWHWQGAVNPDHGRLKYRGQCMYAHRLSYAVHVRELLPGELVLHRCDNATCINPEHLYIGTDSNNQRDRWQRTGAKREHNWPDEPPF